MYLKFTGIDKKFKEYPSNRVFEGYVDDVEYYNVYREGVEFIEGRFRLANSNEKDFFYSKTIPLIAGDYVGFAVETRFLSSKPSNEVLYLKKYDSSSGKILAKYNLYYSGPRHNPYDLSQNKVNRS